MAICVQTSSQALKVTSAFGTELTWGDRRMSCARSRHSKSDNLCTLAQSHHGIPSQLMFRCEPASPAALASDRDGSSLRTSALLHIEFGRLNYMFRRILDACNGIAGILGRDDQFVQL
jgi:hypothetical protein